MNDTPLSVRFAQKSADLATLEAAVLAFSESVGDGLAADIWPRLTCNEVEAVALVFRLAGDDAAASRIIEMHAAGDEPEDDHYKEPAYTVVLEVRADMTNESVATTVASYIQAVTTPGFEVDLISVDTKEA